MALYFDAEPVLTRYSDQDTLNPPSVDTTDWHLPVLKNVRFKGLFGPKYNPCIAGFNEFKRSTPALLVLELENQHKKFCGCEIHTKLF